jgi:hypothetical protein
MEGMAELRAADGDYDLGHLPQYVLNRLQMPDVNWLKSADEQAPVLVVQALEPSAASTNSRSSN